MKSVLHWCVVLLLACASQAAEKKLRVLTTFLPGYCFAANVAGTAANVENLLPSGVNLHDFQLTPAEMRKIAGADLLVVNGLGMETFLERVFANANSATKDKIVTMTAGMESRLIPDEHPHRQHAKAGHDHAFDPHIWQDLRLAIVCVSNIAVALQKADPPNAPVYAANAAAYQDRLRHLDDTLAKDLAPVQTAPFITYHNAFRYLARRYSLDVAGVVEIVPEVSPSPRELAALHRTIRERKATILFTEPGHRTRLAEQIAKDAGIALGELDPLETGEFQPRSYEEGMRRNAVALRKMVP